MTSDLTRTAAWSAIPRAGRTNLRTSSSGHPPRPDWSFFILSPSWPVETGVSVWVRAGRTAMRRLQPQLVGS